MFRSVVRRDAGDDLGEGCHYRDEQYGNPSHIWKRV
jgi:hypothetical protein